MQKKGVYPYEVSFFFEQCAITINNVQLTIIVNCTLLIVNCYILLLLLSTSAINLDGSISMEIILLLAVGITNWK